MIQKTYILDTNVYGELLIEKESLEVIRKIERDKSIDFDIIAVASLKSVDVVVSADKRTMLSQLSTETYDIINKINYLRTPKLVDYFEFRERYKK